MIAKRKIKGIDKIFASLTRVLDYGYVSQKELYYCSLSSYNKKLMKVESPTQQKIQQQCFKSITTPPHSDHCCSRFQGDLASFLYSIRSFRLFGAKNLEYIHEWIQNHWKKMQINWKPYFVSFLAEQRKHLNPVGHIQNFEKQNFPLILIQFYSEFIKNRGVAEEMKGNLSFIKNNSKDKNIHKIWSQQLKFVTLIGQKNVETEPLQGFKKRSPLEIQVQSLLVALQVPFRRQIKINGILVDFLVGDSTIIEVLGPHHFTVEEKLKGRDIVRSLALAQWYDVVFVKFWQLNALHGTQAKLAYLKSLLGKAEKNIAQ